MTFCYIWYKALAAHIKTFFKNIKVKGHQCLDHKLITKNQKKKSSNNRISTLKVQIIQRLLYIIFPLANIMSTAEAGASRCSEK